MGERMFSWLNSILSKIFSHKPPESEHKEEPIHLTIYCSKCSNLIEPCTPKSSSHVGGILKKAGRPKSTTVPMAPVVKRGPYKKRAI